MGRRLFDSLFFIESEGVDQQGFCLQAPSNGEFPIMIYAVEPRQGVVFGNKQSISGFHRATSILKPLEYH